MTGRGLAVVTGASSGIGASLARLLAESGRLVPRSVPVKLSAAVFSRTRPPETS